MLLFRDCLNSAADPSFPRIVSYQRDPRGLEKNFAGAVEGGEKVRRPEGEAGGGPGNHAVAGAAGVGWGGEGEETDEEGEEEGSHGGLLWAWGWKFVNPLRGLGFWLRRVGSGGWMGRELRAGDGKGVGKGGAEGW